MAKSKHGKSQAHTTRTSRQEPTDRKTKRRRNANTFVIGFAAFLVLITAGVIFLSIRGQGAAGAEEVAPTQGNAHITQDTIAPIKYNTTPPTSGPHYGGLAPWGISTQPQRYEQLLHNLEDGGVVIYYQCADGCPDLVDQLAAVVKPYADQNRKVVLLPNDPTWTDNGTQPLHKDMDARISLTTWQRIDKFDDFDAERVRSFIDRYEGIDHHR